MNIDNALRGKMQYNSQLAGASRGSQQALSTQRTKKKSFAQKLGGFAKGIAQVGLSVAGSAIPGGNIISSAISSAMGGTGGSAASGLGGDMMSQMASQNMAFLALQNNIQQQSRQYQTISNALTASHQAASNSIRNLK